MQLVVGLGNPGKRYAGTRHNVGFDVVTRLGARFGIRADSPQLGSLTGSGEVGGQKVQLVLPQSFMNLSGQPVGSIAGYYKVPPEEVVVVHDDLDLPFGDVRCKAGGGHGGHNGLRDLHRHIGPDYLRVRVGIGRPPEGRQTVDHVLSPWTTEERAALDPVVDTAADAVEAILHDGVRAAMNRFNVRGGSSPPISPVPTPAPGPSPEQ